MKRLFISIIIILLFSGCQNYEEINNYAIVSGISIDKAENNDLYKVGIQIMNAKKDEESNNSLITSYESTGKTIYEALEKITLDSPKKIYLGHNEVIVISEELLKEKNPLDYLDFFMRDSKVEKDSFVIIAKESKAYDILKIITPLETIPSRNLKATLTVADTYSGSLTIVTIDEFISDLSSKTKEPIIPSVKIKGNNKSGDDMDNIKKSDPDVKLEFSTLGFFENNLLKGYLSSDESVGFNFLNNTQNETYVNTKCDNNNYTSIKIKDSKNKEKLTFKDNVPIVNLNIDITAELKEYNCSADFIKDEKFLKTMEKKFNKKIINLINKAINKLYKENKSDVLDYGGKFYKTKYKEMNKLNYKKTNIKNNLKFNIKVNTNIDSVGLSIRSIKEFKDE